MTQPYADCPDAIREAEAINEEADWRDWRRRGFSPDDAVKVFKTGIRLADEQATAQGGLETPEDEQRRRQTLAALPQFDAPGFRHYCAAKLGLM